MQTHENTIYINNKIIQEKNEEMDKLNRDIPAIREIYKDLALLVTEQGEQINIMSDNIENTARETEKALTQLQISEKRSRKKCIISYDNI